MPSALTVFPCFLLAYVPEEELKAAVIDEGSVEEDGLPGDVQEADFVRELVMDSEGWPAALRGVAESDMTEQLN